MTVGWLVAEDGAEVDVGKEGGRLRLMSVRIEADVGKEGGRLRLMSVRIEVDAEADVGKEGRRVGG